MTLFIAHISSNYYQKKGVVCGTIIKLFYSYIPLHYSTFPLHVCIQHSGPEIKWVDGGKQLLKISTHLVSTVYTQVSCKTN